VLPVTALGVLLPPVVIAVAARAAESLVLGEVPVEPLVPEPGPPGAGVSALPCVPEPPVSGPPLVP
jgi:hypothetical protein